MRMKNKRKRMIVEKIDITKRVQALTIVTGVDEHIVMVNVLLHNCDEQVSKKEMYYCAIAVLKASLEDLDKEIDSYSSKIKGD